MEATRKWQNPTRMKKLKELYAGEPTSELLKMHNNILHNLSRMTFDNITEEDGHNHQVGVCICQELLRRSVEGE